MTGPSLPSRHWYHPGAARRKAATNWLCQKQQGGEQPGRLPRKIRILLSSGAMPSRHEIAFSELKEWKEVDVSNLLDTPLQQCASVPEPPLRNYLLPCSGRRSQLWVRLSLPDCIRCHPSPPRHSGCTSAQQNQGNRLQKI